MMTRTSLLIAASIMMAIAGGPACGASVALENRPCPCATGWTCCAQQNVCVAESTSCAGAAAPLGGFSTSAVSNARSVCAASTTEGALERPTSAADATAKLAGGWMPCNRARWLADRGGDAIVIAVDGTWSLLKLDGDGALAPLTGLGTHGTWRVYGEGSSSPLDRTDASTNTINVLGFVDDGAVPGPPSTAALDFEAGSARMRLSRPQASPPEEAWFAPLPGGPRAPAADAGN